MKNLTLTLLFIMVFAVSSFAATPQITKDFKEAISEGSLGGYEIHHALAYFQATTSELVASNNPIADYPFRAAAGTFEVSSSSASDLGDVTIAYLDENWDAQTVTMTLTGQTPVVSTVSAIRFWSATLISDPTNEENQGDIYVFYDSTTTSGVPDTLANVFLKINAEESVSKMAVFSTPRNYSGVLVNQFLNGPTGTTGTMTNTAYLGLGTVGTDRINYVADKITVGIVPDSKFEGPVYVAPQSDVWLTVSVSSTIPVRTGFTLYLKPTN